MMVRGHDRHDEKPAWWIWPSTSSISCRRVLRQVPALPRGLSACQIYRYHAARPGRGHRAAGAHSGDFDEASLCALAHGGQSVLTTIKYLEMIRAISGHRCPAGVCKPLITYRIIKRNAPAAAVVEPCRPRPSRRAEGPVILDQRSASSAAPAIHLHLKAVAIK